MDNLETDIAKPELKRPSLYNVILLNDDFTSWDFVVFILEKIFMHDNVTAEAITSDVHASGRGVAGTYTKDIAETKAGKVNTTAQLNEMPLKAIIESNE